MSTKACPRCNTLNPAGARFCMSCGEPLGEAAANHAPIQAPSSPEATNQKGAATHVEVQPAQIREAPKQKAGCLTRTLIGVLVLIGLLVFCGVMTLFFGETPSSSSTEAGAAGETAGSKAAATLSGGVVEDAPAATAGPTPTPGPADTPTSAPTPTKTLAELKAMAQTGVAYEDLLRYPERYEGQLLAFEGRVFQVQEAWFGSYVYLIQVTKGEFGVWDDSIWVSFDEDARILEGDLVSFFGEYGGRHSYTAVMGNKITVPKITAYEIVRTGSAE